MAKKSEINYDPVQNALMHAVTSRAFRETLLDIYPKLTRRESYLKLAAHLLFSTFLDECSGGVVLPWETLGMIEGKEAEVRHRKYDGTSFLERFRDEVISPASMKWTSFHYSVNRARAVLVDWPYEINSAIEMTYQYSKHLLQQVYLVSGKRFNRVAQSREFAHRCKRAAVEVARRDPAAKPIIDYLNKQSSKLYTQIVNRNIHSARETVNAQISDPGVRRQQHNILSQIQSFPKPIYVPSNLGNTDRIFTVSSSYLGLKRCVREALLHGWYDYDLRSAQLAIAATLWEMPTVMEFLETSNIWQSLMVHVGLDNMAAAGGAAYYEPIKKAIKIALYSTLYGMQEKNIYYQFANNLVISSDTKAAKLMDHPLFRKILDQRERVMTKIRQTGYGETCFGKRIPVQHLSRNRDNVTSILAQQAQAMELLILLPAVECAKTSRGELVIPIWCHDGFIAHYTDPRRRELWDSRLRAAVSAQTHYLNIKTILECKPL